MQFQGIPPACEPDALNFWRKTFDEKQRSLANTSNMDRVNIRSKNGQHYYAVAIKKDGTLFLTLWLKCATEGDIYVFYPQPEGKWNPHASYHSNGQCHKKSYGHIGLKQKRQPLNSAFCGSEHLGYFTGHGTSMGAICEQSDFDGVVIVDPWVLGPIHGSVCVDIIQPGFEETWTSEFAPKL